ncbi:hypothetical protein B0T09DRAFT_396801 [Sordaria sp. MPI-SDFR-AT-0083]|nr:hypothetical protein B0T09DRAFT_396801 [Sordaria sp. MPI-SDFR-AT-0083]
MYKACGHTEFRRFMCNPVPLSINDDKSDLDPSRQANTKSGFACGKQPEHVNDLELGHCGHCPRNKREPDKGAGRGRTSFGKEQSRKGAGVQVFVSQYDAERPENDDKTDNVQMLPGDVVEERRLFKQRIAEAAEECGQFREEIGKGQAKTSSLLDAVRSLSDHSAELDKGSTPAVITTDCPTTPKAVNTDSTPRPPRHAHQHHLSHSVTKVRRDLFCCKRHVSPVISSMNHKSMVSTLVSTTSRQSEPQEPTKPQPPVSVKNKQSNGPSRRPLPPGLCSDPQTLPKAANLQVLAKHRFHRLVCVPEESTCQSLVVANSTANNIVLRRAKAIKVCNLNAFHCPVLKPRFGLKRKVLAPPVPKHSTPPRRLILLSSSTNTNNPNNPSGNTPNSNPTYGKQFIAAMTHVQAQVHGRVQSEMQEWRHQPADPTRDQVLAYLHEHVAERGQELIWEHMLAETQEVFWEGVRARAQAQGREEEQVAAREQVEHWKQMQAQASEKIREMMREFRESVAREQEGARK